MEEKRDARGLTEEEAIERYRSRNYPKPALTADIVVLWLDGEAVKVLLVERGGHPYIEKFALPGGFANENEPVEETAARELQEESGVSGLPMTLVGVFSRPGRDPRGWVVSAAYAAVIREAPMLRAGDDAAAAGWFSVEWTDGNLLLRQKDVTIMAEDLAFDHAEILQEALKQCVPQLFAEQ